MPFYFLTKYKKSYIIKFPYFYVVKSFGNTQTHKPKRKYFINQPKQNKEK